jgi:hypothetical protein
MNPTWADPDNAEMFAADRVVSVVDEQAANSRAVTAMYGRIIARRCSSFIISFPDTAQG